MKKTNDLINDIFKTHDSLFGMVSKITKTSNNKSKTAFGDLVASQQNQIMIISNTYEDEIVSLTKEFENKNEILKNELAKLNAKIENLEDNLSVIRNLKPIKEEKNVKKKFKQKVSK